MKTQVHLQTQGFIFYISHKFVDTFLRYLVKCTTRFSILIPPGDNLTQTFYIVSSKLDFTIS